MAHTTYKTKGVVIENITVGEAHCYLILFTEKLGLVRVLARSGREERSKLRYHIQPFSKGNFSLVRGKDVWRLVGASLQQNLYHEYIEYPFKISILARYFSLLKRIVGFEENQSELFTFLEEGISFLKRSSDQEAVENLEYLLVLRTLLMLGYVGEHKMLTSVLQPTPITPDTLRRISPLRRMVIVEINRALRESQL